LSSQVNFIWTDIKAFRNGESGTILSGELFGYAATEKGRLETLLN
jgi:hypothetical protein